MKVKTEFLINDFEYRELVVSGLTNSGYPVKIDIRERFTHSLENDYYIIVYEKE